MSWTPPSFIRTLVLIRTAQPQVIISILTLLLHNQSNSGIYILCDFIQDSSCIPRNPLISPSSRIPPKCRALTIRTTSIPSRVAILNSNNHTAKALNMISNGNNMVASNILSKAMVLLKVMVHLPDKTATAHLNKAAFSTVNKECNMALTMQAILKVTQDTSKLCLETRFPLAVILIATLSGEGANRQGGYGQPQYGQQQAQGQPQYGQEGQQQVRPEDIPPQSSDPNLPNYDPNAPPLPEGERGLLGGIGGAWAGHHFGGKAGHGILGTIGGAIAGSFLEDKFKDRKHGSHQGGSSWGGKW